MVFSKTASPSDRKSTRLNSSHITISYAVFCLKKKINITRRNPNLDRVREKTNDSNSHYNGLQVKFIRQAGAGVTFTTAYTFSKVMDQQGVMNNGDNGQRDPSTSLDPDDPAREWGRAAHDATHVFSSSASYPFPFRFTNRASLVSVVGWEVS